MVRYEIKNMKGQAEKIQKQIEAWIKIKDHIVIKSINIWAEKDISYATVIYKQKQFY